MARPSALSEALRQRVYPHSRLKGEANLLVFPNLDSANITLTAVRRLCGTFGLPPLLTGPAGAEFFVLIIFLTALSISSGS